jgi:hypothetical protein
MFFTMWVNMLPSIANVPAITSTSDFFTLGGTISFLAQVLDQMRKEFRKTLMLLGLAYNPTLRGMTAVAINQISVFSLGSTAIDWKTETARAIINNRGFRSAEVKSGQNLIVLLTGATGSLGRTILAQSTDSPEVALIHCVTIHSPGKVPQRPKVIYHTGDLTLPYFGLPDSTWISFGTSIDTIIPAAALIDPIRY